MSTSTNASAARTGPRRRCGTLAADERSWVSRACIQWTATLAGAIRRRGARRDGCEERVDARSSARARSLRTPTSRRPASSDYADPNALSQTSHITRDPPYHALRSIPLHERGEKTTMTRVEDASRASQPTAPPTASDPPADEQRLRPSFSVAPFFFFGALAAEPREAWPEEASRSVRSQSRTDGRQRYTYGTQCAVLMLRKNGGPLPQQSFSKTQRKRDRITRLFKDSPVSALCPVVSPSQTRPETDKT